MRIGARYSSASTPSGQQQVNVFLNYPGYANRLYVGKPGTWIDSTLTEEDVIGIEEHPDGSRIAHISKAVVLAGIPHTQVQIMLDVKLDIPAQKVGSAQWVVSSASGVVLDSGGYISPPFRVVVDP